ncbi:MAG: hypothetical protein ACYC5M_04160 [Anaerolineae bacterium]
MTDNNTDVRGSGRKRARGAFPRLPLEKVLVLPLAIYEMGQGDQVRRLDVFEHIGRSASSSTSREMVIAANSGYALVTGGYNAEKLGLSSLGIKLASSDSEVDRLAAVHESLFSCAIFAALITKFQNKYVPLDQVALTYLSEDHNLSAEDASECWEVVKANINYGNLTGRHAGKPTIVPREAALEKARATSANVGTADEIRAQSSTIVKDLTRSSGVGDQGRYSEPQIHFNIQVVIPENATPEVYDSIFRSIATHLLGHERD